MKFAVIVRVIGFYQIILGLVGGGFALWSIMYQGVLVESFSFMYVFIAYSFLAIISGIFLFMDMIFGLWLSVCVQIIAIPVYISGDTTYKFNNLLSLSIDHRTDVSGFGLDLFSALLCIVLLIYRNRRWNPK